VEVKGRVGLAGSTHLASHTPHHIRVPRALIVVILLATLTNYHIGVRALPAQRPQRLGAGRRFPPWA
jgi:hypothetical protein